MLGGFNLANLVLRLVLFLGFFLLGVAISSAYGSRGAVRAIAGTPGKIVLGVVLVLILAMFILTMIENHISSTGLRDQLQFGVKPALVYHVLGWVYPGYVAAVLIGLIIRDSAGTNGLDRVVNLLLMLAFLGIIPLSVLEAVKLYVNVTPLSVGHLIMQYSVLNILGIAFLVLQYMGRERTILTNSNDAGAETVSQDS